MARQTAFSILQELRSKHPRMSPTKFTKLAMQRMRGRAKPARGASEVVRAVERCVIIVEKMNALKAKWAKIPTDIKLANPELAKWFGGRRPTQVRRQLKARVDRSTGSPSRRASRRQTR